MAAIPTNNSQIVIPDITLPTDITPVDVECSKTGMVLGLSLFLIGYIYVLPRLFNKNSK